jgi:hypothetical protein
LEENFAEGNGLGAEEGDLERFVGELQFSAEDGLGWKL